MRRSKVAGFTLIELMVGMILGLLISSAAVTIVLAVGRSNDTVESLSRLQENTRIGFELLARDVREAGGNACARNIPVANVLENSATAWWANWTNAVRGYDDTQAFADADFGSAAGQRVSGTDAVELKSSAASGYTVESHQPASAVIKINAAGHNLLSGNIVMICDYRQAAIMQITGANSANRTIVHNAGGSVSPGNCSKGLGFKQPMSCTTNGTAYTYAPNAQIAHLRATRWYVGNNGRGGRSLYQSALRGTSTSASAIVQEEVLEGVTDLQLEYLLTGASSYVAASAVGGAAWGNVQAMRITLTIAGGQGADATRQRVSTDGTALTRQVSHVVALRNRTQ